MQEWLDNLQYLFNEDSGKDVLKLKGEDYKYLFKVRRHDVDDVLYFRSKNKSQELYKYKVLFIDAKSASLELLSSEIKEVGAKKEFHLAWCVIDPKSVEKVLPSLNEIGVTKITFIYCERSQKNYKVDLKRYERILETSSQQCGRSTDMKFEIVKNISTFLQEHKDVSVLDFCDNVLDKEDDIKIALIGCEGGFSETERGLLKSLNNFRLDTPMILRSESAAVAIASKVVL